MNSNEMLNKVEAFVHQILEGFPEVFLVQVKHKPTNNFKVYIDTDEGITIETCIKINRLLYKAIEEAALFDEGDFSLEVSSPGVGEPILLHRQYRKNMGRFLLVQKLDGAQLEGKLSETTEDGILLETTVGKGKKAEVILHSILFSDIKKATVEIKF